MSELQFPTVTQYASPDLITAIAYEGHDRGDDPRWAESGAPDLDTYRRWCGHMCGIACLRMAILARHGDAPTLFELLDGARKYGAYTEDPDTGSIRGLIYAPFAQYVADAHHRVDAEVHPSLTVPDLLALLDSGRLVMTSVHKEIRRPENPAPGKGGHLVLVTGHHGDTLYFRNPSGHTEQARTATLPVAEFAEFFAGRGVSLT
ncbi:C39 family peptidase [Streptomyces sp. AP-93]|uniref:C39 family peptidase n=1 Tax=Streptomyces sp. AP-93 TaxID=2929048 RepID=UPI001FAF038A|nr:C39 family peptidase [Streptomyces sp. AP-93]MCJ0875250.1 C39 family peptidase [Streptomyces sp. AP-93]